MPRLCLTPTQALEFSESDPMLIQIVAWLADRWPTSSMLVTSIYRDKAEDDKLSGSGIHATWPPRACDIRTRNLGADEVGIACRIAQEVNARWVYDQSRPRLRVALAHTGSAFHLHIQVHPQTRLRSERA